MSASTHPTAPAAATPQAGIFHRARVRLFGERDAVADQLREIARQGASMAHLAHACAFALIILFSAGSLVALGGDALGAILAGWQRGQVDIPAAISIAVSTLLVLCCDVGMVYAASMLRLLATRRADASERRIHQIVMVTVAALEAATYAYMSARYEHPAGAVVWALILARACAAPLLSVYLSMARPLPITARDILYQAELAAGQGVIRDVVTVAADAGAPLAEKMALYGAAAVMSAGDRLRLDGMITAVAKRHALADHLPSAGGMIAPAAASPIALPAPAPDAPDRPPTGPGSPTAASDASKHRGTGRDRRNGGTAIQLVEPPEWRDERTRTRRTASAEQRVRRVLAAEPAISTRQLAKRARVSDSTASKWRALWRQERAQIAEPVQAVAQ